MRLLIRVCAAVLATSCGAASAPGGSAAHGASSPTRDSLIAGLREYAAAAQAFDSARVMAVLVNDSTFRFVEGHTTYTREGFARLVGDAFGTLKAFEARFDYDSLAVIALSPTSAVTVVPYTDLLTEKSGAVVTVRGVVTWVWTVRDGRLRLAAGHAGALPPQTSK